MPLQDSIRSFMNFSQVLDLLEFKNQASQCFAGNQRCPGVWKSFPFLTWDLSMHPATNILVLNEFICTGACACTSNLNYAHKCIENSLNAKEMSKRTPKNHKNSHNTPVVLCWHENKFESNKRQWISFRPQRWDVPYRNHDACCEKLWFVRSIYPNLPQMGQNLYHSMLMPLHDSMPSFMNFRRVLDLL